MTRLQRLVPLLVLLACTVTGRARAQSADVDLLHAVEAAVAVSSAYRDRRTQVDALVDGDLETAWNSRTGELAGAWIDVRVPASARVTAIAMTAGFTHVHDGRDLFEGNHRVARVRVLRDGVLVREQALDPTNRALQSIPIDREGGVFRVEIVGVLAGSRTDWREVCVSELRVLGHAPGAVEGARVPRTAVGALPPPPAPVVPPSAAQLERLQRQRVAAIEREWLAIEAIADLGREGSAPDESWGADVADLLRQRRAVLTRTADLVAQLDAAEADALRLAAQRTIPTEWASWQHEPHLADDLAALGRAMDFVTARIGTDAARCRWARARGRLLLARAASFARAEREHAEIDESDREMAGGRTSRAEGRRIDSLYAIAEALDAAAAEWSRNTRGVAARLRRLTPPPGARAEADLAALRAQLDVAQAACGW